MFMQLVNCFEITTSGCCKKPKNVKTMQMTDVACDTYNILNAIH